jgi:tetratricopeptide (TPR) repeat protein
MKKDRPNNTTRDSFENVAFAELATGWLERLIQKADHKEASRIIKSLRNHNRNLVSSSNLHQFELDVLDATFRVKTTSDESFHSAQRLLNFAIKQLGRMQKSDKRDIILASAYNVFGYLLRVQGKYYGARSMYQKALPIWRKLRLDEEQATTLNNLSFTLAEIGVYPIAQNMAFDALELRQKLHNFSITPLVLNTLAHIAVRENKPDVAVRYVGHALKRNLQIPNLRARGLTLIVGSEAHRRRMKSREHNDVDRLEDLQTALAYAQEACEIFSNNIIEPGRHVEALIELGCVYRDYAKYSRQGFKVTTKSKLYGTKSEESLVLAAKIAKREKIIFRAVDALVNLAWLKYYLRENVDNVLSKALAQIPSKFLKIHNRGVSLKDMDTLVVPYQTLLGKAHALKGQLHFSLFNDRKITSEIKKNNLDLAVQFHALALQYNSMVSQAVILPVRRTQERIYKNVRRLNQSELLIVLKTLDRFEHDHQIRGGCEMRKFLAWNGLIDD